VLRRRTSAHHLGGGGRRGDLYPKRHERTTSRYSNRLPGSQSDPLDADADTDADTDTDTDERPRQASRRGWEVATMCGIVGCIGDVSVLDRILSGLEHLEYRGYDSAGISVANGDGLSTYKRACEVSALRADAETVVEEGVAGVGHTRWATHGPPTDENAHPHEDCTGQVAVVHNGVIDNHDELRTELAAAGHEFTSDTDTEVIPHLVEHYLDEGDDPERAVRRSVDRLDGSYAVVVLVDGADGLLVARNDSPLAIGVADGTRYVGSDVPAFLQYTDSVVYLADGDVATLEPDDHRVTDERGEIVDRPVDTVDWRPEDTRKAEHDHFMKKEIDEQPTAVARSIEGRIDGDAGSVSFSEFPPDAFEEVESVQFVACGTSYHAALYGRHLLTRRGVPAQASLASEYAHAPLPVDDRTLVVGVTQSGETADTLSALRRARDRGARTLALTNVEGSTVTRECDDVCYIHAGPEIGVAATKTFSSQVATLVLLVEEIAGPDEETPERLAALSRLPEDTDRVLERTRAADVTRRYSEADAYFFLGRGAAHPVALEGALKLKEISYEHAEGFPAGELKHGPLALVTEATPVFAVLSGRRDEATITNVEEVSTRGAPVVAVTDRDRDTVDAAAETLWIPETHPDIAPVLANIQLQLVSYHLADLLGRAIDKPRNLAKSVTVR
jgi:glucosamine--fructose-6-phosphate aminotransferase (isomerizing)